MKKLFICVVGMLFCVFSANAQIEKKNLGENKVIPAKVDPKNKEKEKNPPIDSTQNQPLKFDLPTPSPLEDIKEKIEFDGAADAGFKLFKKPDPIVGRDPLQDLVGKKQLVRISEEIYIDSVWVKAAEYYTIWDSQNINPYGRDASIFKDTVKLRLYNSAEGEYWAAPLDRILQTSSFGPRWGSFHHGVDLDLKMGTPVYTAFDGIVRISTFGNNGYGNYVVIRHRNGLETLYGHLSKRAVEVGQVLKAGQLIGLGGSTGWSTGPHLHLETRYEGNTINPLLIYDFSKPQILMTEYFSIMPHHFAHLGNKVRRVPIHIVTPNETLSIISAKYNVPVDTLIKLNNLTASSELKVGQAIKIR